MQSWAYDFDCATDLQAMAVAMNNAGPWNWQARESYWYGDYLNARSLPGLRVRIHQYPQTVDAGSQFTGPRDHGFMVLLEINDESAATRDAVDRLFRVLLESIGAAVVASIEPYD